MCVNSLQKFYEEGIGHRLFTYTFTTNLTLQHPQDDLVAFPLGIFFLLASLLNSNAARESTGTQISHALDVVGSEQGEEGAVNLSYLDVYRNLTSSIAVTNATSNVTVDAPSVDNLCIGSVMLFKPGFDYNSNFSTSVQKEFNVNLLQVNFSEPYRTIRTVNDLVYEKCKGSITRFFEPSTDLPVYARMVLLSIVHFKDFNAATYCVSKDKWIDSFEPSETSSEEFYITDRDKIRVPMMNAIRQINYTDRAGEGFKMISLPMQNSRFFFLILLPERINDMKVLNEIFENTYHIDEWLKNMEEKQVHIKLPKFTTETRLNLRQTLMQMGIEDAFSRARANFSGISNKQRLHIDEFQQKTLLQINEFGIGVDGLPLTIPASTIQSSPMLSSAAIDDRSNEQERHFTVDRSFACLIYDNQLRVPLILAKIRHPRLDADQFGPIV